MQADVDHSLPEFDRSSEIQKKNPKNVKPWQTSFVSHLLPIYIKKLELHQLIYTSLHKYEHRVEGSFHVRQI